MNKTRRALLAKLYTKLDDLKCDLQTLQEEEHEYYDNMPESLQGSVKGEDSETAASNLEEACDSLEEALGKVEEAQE